MKKLITILTIIFLPFYLMAQENDSDLYIDAFIVIADSSYNYIELRKEMYEISNELNISIDTMGREFDVEKKLICLPKNDSDELYAGGYFPRRYPSESLSLEHLIYYTKGKEPKGGEIIILVVGIYNRKEDAEALINKMNSSKAYILNVKMYMGCMH